MDILAPDLMALLEQLSRETHKEHCTKHTITLEDTVAALLGQTAEASF